MVDANEETTPATPVPTRVTGVILLELDLADFGGNDPQTALVREVLLAVAQTTRHRVVGQGVSVAGVSAVLVPRGAAPGVVVPAA